MRSVMAIRRYTRGVRAGAAARSLCVVLVLLTRAPAALAADDLRAFPPAGDGMTRHVIRLAKQEDESAFRVEVIVGKTVRTDAQNRYFFGGRMQAEVIPGWGYERHVLRELGPMAGTLMAIDPGAPQVERFIGLGGEARLLRYNSRLPIVVYVPEGVEVRHRIWRAEPAMRFVQKVALSAGQTAVVAEGEFEARSTGSYSVRVYAAQGARPGDDTTFFSMGAVRARDGTLEKAFAADLGDGGPPSLVVTIRGAGSGGYLSADAFAIGGDNVSLRASVSGLPAGADAVAALAAVLRDPRRTSATRPGAR